MKLVKRELPALWILFGSIVVSFLLYGNTLWNKYCLDDAIVITQNNFTQKGLSGIDDIFTKESFTGFFGEQKQLVSGARYRPLSIATFAIEYEFLGKNPAFSHFINILLFGLTVFLLFLVIKHSLNKFYPKAQLLALFTVALFLFHPIHTEVVANIKGRDEILALLFSLWATWLLIKHFETGKGVFLYTGAFVWLIALFSKENAFVFIAIFPVVLMFLPDFNSKKVIKPLAIYAVSAVIFIVVRQLVIGGLFFEDSNELMNNPFLYATQNQKFATIFYTLGIYLKLLIFPQPLTYDYYPYQIKLVEWSSILPLIIFIFYCFLCVKALQIFKKKSIISLSIIFFLLPVIPVSNIFFPIGTFLNERFLYFSSIGFCLFTGYILVNMVDNAKFRWIPTYLFPIVLLLFGFKTISRNNTWYNDYTLFTTDVKTSVNSAKSNCSAGGILIDNVDTIQNITRKNLIINRAIGYLNKAISIHPKYTDAWILLGNAWFKKNNYDSAMFCYTSILKMNPENKLILGNILAVGEKISGVDNKIGIYKTILNYDSTNFVYYYKLGQLYGKEKNDLPKSINYFFKAMRLNNHSKEVYLDLGVAYGLQKEFEKSAEMLEKASNIDPSDGNIYRNLGVTYQLSGNMKKAKENFAMADSIFKQKK